MEEVISTTAAEDKAAFDTALPILTSPALVWEWVCADLSGEGASVSLPLCSVMVQLASPAPLVKPDMLTFRTLSLEGGVLPRDLAPVRTTEEDLDCLESKLSKELRELDMLRNEKRRIVFSVLGAMAVLGVYSATGKNDSLPAYARKSET